MLTFAVAPIHIRMYIKPKIIDFPVSEQCGCRVWLETQLQNTFLIFEQNLGILFLPYEVLHCCMCIM